MTAIIERRVARLEESAGGGGDECSYCGDDGRNYELVFVDPPEDGDEPEELCPECGRQLYITLDWGD